MHKRQFAVIYISLIPILLALGVIVTDAHASGKVEIELTDGTVIAGEIISMSNDVYTVRSVSLGTIHVQASNIRIIRLKGSGSSPDTGGDQVRSLQEQMTGNGKIMDLIRDLERDQDLQEVLNDPEIMKAIQSGDISALMANPKFIKLLNKPSIQQIENELGK